MPWSRRISPRALLAPAVLLLVPFTAVPGVAAPPCGRAAAASAGRWFVTTPPSEPHSDVHQDVHGDVRGLHAVAVDPADPRVVLATDGDALDRTDDGGCSWRRVWRLPDSPAADLPSRDVGEITAIHVAHAGGASRVTLAVTAVGWGLTVQGGTYLVTSADGRTGWSSSGLQAGRYDDARGFWPPLLHDGARGTLYAAIPSPLGLVSYLRTTDGGRTWTTQTALTSLPDNPTSAAGFAVSPYDPDDVWEWGGWTTKTGDPRTGLRHSTDGAATWTWVDPWPSFAREEPPTWTAADVAWPRPGRPARVLVLGQRAHVVAPPPVGSWSGDSGRTFQAIVPGTRNVALHAALTHTPAGDAVLVVENGAAYRIGCATRAPTYLDWRPLPTAPVAPDEVWARFGTDLLRSSATAPPVVVVPTSRQIELLTVVR